MYHSVVPRKERITMSRQYDDFVDSHYEYNGEWHGLVEPENLPQLASAFNVVAELQDLIDRILLQIANPSTPGSMRSRITRS